ncbi:hypothetical protein TNCV_3864171 [Trichonephila clavipes]|nr:hypothetical protein TNCV_3864171 [Trichonephila clavipes]
MVYPVRRIGHALAEHSGTAFTPRVTLPGENSPDVFHPFHPGTPPRHDEAARCTRWGNDQTIVSRLFSGHLKYMTFESGRKVFSDLSQVSPVAGFP